MSGSRELHDVVAAHEGDGALAFQCGQGCISCLAVGPELVVPDVAGVLIVHDLQVPCLVGFETMDVDEEGIAINDYPLALA